MRSYNVLIDLSPQHLRIPSECRATMSATSGAMSNALLVGKDDRTAGDDEEDLQPDGSGHDTYADNRGNDVRTMVITTSSPSTRDSASFGGPRSRPREEEDYDNDDAEKTVDYWMTGGSVTDQRGAKKMSSRVERCEGGRFGQVGRSLVIIVLIHACDNIFFASLRHV